MKKGTKLRDNLVLRRRAIELHKLGKKQQFIADVLGVDQSTVSKWVRAYKALGAESLKYPKIGGSKRKINPEQEQELVGFLNEGAESHGFEGDFWTRARVRDLIENKFGIVYKERAVGNILKALGFTVQKPGKKTYKQDPEKVKEWKEKTLPSLKKS